MAKLQIKKATDKKFAVSADYDFLIDGQNIKDIISKVTSINIDFDAESVPELTIKAHLTDVETGGIEFDAPTLDVGENFVAEDNLATLHKGEVVDPGGYERNVVIEKNDNGDDVKAVYHNLKQDD